MKTLGTNKLDPYSHCLVIVLAITAILISGCGRNAVTEAHSEENVVKYHAKSGLFVPKAAAEYMGLELTDVEDQKVEQSIQFMAQVYQTGKEQAASKSLPALLSGMVHLSDAEWLKPGQLAEVRWNGGQALHGRISKINRALEGVSGQIEVLTEVDSQENEIPQGAFVQVTVKGELGNSGVSIPRSALLKTVEGNFVYTVSGDHFVRTPITTGSVNEKFVEVTDGLYSGDQVVVKPVMTLWVTELQSIRGGKACADGH